MKTKKKHHTEDAGQQVTAHPVDNSDLLALESQIDIQKRSIHATIEHRDRQADLAKAWAHLSTVVSRQNETEESRRAAYHALGIARHAAGVAEYNKFTIEIEFAARQVSQMEEILNQMKAQRGVE